MSKAAKTMHGRWVENTAATLVGSDSGLRRRLVRVRFRGLGFRGLGFAVHDIADFFARAFIAVPAHSVTSSTCSPLEQGFLGQVVVGERAG